MINIFVEIHWRTKKGNTLHYLEQCLTQLVGRWQEKVGQFVMIAGSLMVSLVIVLVLLKPQYFVPMVAVKAMAELWP